MIGTTLRAVDVPKHFADDAVEVWQAFTILIIGQARATDDAVDLGLRLLEYLWIKRHREHEVGHGSGRLSLASTKGNSGVF